MNSSTNDIHKSPINKQPALLNDNSPYDSKITPVKLLNVFKGDNDMSSNNPTPSPMQPFNSKLGTTPKKAFGSKVQ